METEIYTEEWNEIEWNRYIRIKINGMDAIFVSALIIFWKIVYFLKNIFWKIILFFGV